MPNLLDNPETSFFVIDPKGITAMRSAVWRQNQGHKIVIFNPYGEQAFELAKLGFTQFHGFNPLANLEPKSDRFSLNVRFIAEALVYGEKGSNKHFSDAARGLVSFLIKYLVTEPTETPTLGRLYQLVAGGFDYLDTKAKDGGPDVFSKAQLSSCESVRTGWRRWNSGSKEVTDVFSTAQTQLAFLDNPTLCRALTGGQFDFAALKKDKITVYLILPFESIITDEVRYLRLILLSAMSQFYQTPKNRETLVILDEFGNLGPLDVIKDGMGAIREYGVKLWPFLQSLSQLQELYPKGWPGFIANASVTSIFDINDPETAEYFSKRAGRILVPRITHQTNKSDTESLNKKTFLGLRIPQAQRGGADQTSTSGGTSTTDTETDALPVADIYNLPGDGLLTFCKGQASPDKAVKLAAWRDEPFRSRSAAMFPEAAPRLARPVEETT